MLGKIVVNIHKGSFTELFRNSIFLKILKMKEIINKKNLQPKKERI